MKAKIVEVRYNETGRDNDTQYGVFAVYKKSHNPTECTKVAYNYKAIASLLGLRAHYVKGLAAACNGTLFNSEVCFADLKDCKTFCSGLNQISKAMNTLINEVGNR